MSYAIHVASKYQVEYDCRASASLRSTDLNYMLYFLCPDGAFGDTVADSDFIELGKAEISLAIDRLKNPDADLLQELADNGYEAGELIEMLEYWQQKSDPANDFVALQWF